MDTTAETLGFAVRCRPERARRWRSGVTMVETTLVLMVGAVLAVIVTTAAVSLIARQNADARAQEVRLILDTIWASYTKTSDYAGLGTASIAVLLPNQLTDSDKDEISLGGGELTVTIGTGTGATGAITNASSVGASAAKTFVVSIGNADFPITEPLTCQRIVELFDAQEPRFRGFQIAPAGATPDTAKATTLTVMLVGTGVTQTFPAAGTAPNIYAAATYALREVQSQNIAHACEVTSELGGGASVHLAFL